MATSSFYPGDSCCTHLECAELRSWREKVFERLCLFGDTEVYQPLCGGCFGSRGRLAGLKPPETMY
jgi:hypothetical protein